MLMIAERGMRDCCVRLVYQRHHLRRFDVSWSAVFVEVRMPSLNEPPIGLLDGMGRGIQWSAENPIGMLQFLELVVV